MLTLVSRKSSDKFAGYFGRDFESPMWECGLDSTLREQLRPRVAGSAGGIFQPEKWTTLDATRFSRVISEVAEVVVSGGILAYELVLSAPKSVSVAALAGSQVEGRILEAHLSAVDDVLSLIAPNLFERRMEEKRAFVNPSDATFLAFTHPWNRVIEPQLHTHVTISRPRGGNALWGYPLFLLQRTLRAIYHYSLVSRLRGQGFRIRVGEPWSLAWELGGIADAVIWKFTERTKAIREQVARTSKGCFSQAAETRLVALASRRQLPQTNPVVTLQEARKRWARKVAPIRCAPTTAVTRDPGPFRDPVALKEIFRTSSVIAPAQFQAAHLAAWLGSGVGLADALAHVSSLLACYQRDGILIRDGRGICFPEMFDVEEDILERLADGYRAGEKLRWKQPGLWKNKWLEKVLQPVAKLRDRIRIGCLFGERLPQGVRLENRNGADMTRALITIEKWDPVIALKLLDQRSDEIAVLLVQEGFRKGDFLQRLHRLMPWYRAEEHVEVGRPFRIFNKHVTVIHGDLSALLPPPSGKVGIVKRISRSLGQVIGFGGPEDSVLDPAAVVWGPQFDAKKIATLNAEILNRRAGKGGLRQQLCEEVAWVKLLADGEWRGLGIFCLRNVDAPRGEWESDPDAGSYRHGDTWWFSGPPRDGVVPARGLRHLRMISLSHLRHVLQGKQAENLILVGQKEVYVLPGMAFVSRRRFSDRSHLFREGEVLVLRRIEPDGAWIFWDGARLENPSRLLQPVAAVGGFIPKQRALSRVIADIPPDSRVLERLKALPCNGVVTVLSSMAKELCRRIRVDVSAINQLKQHETAKKILFAEGDEEEGFFPPRSRWAELIAGKRLEIEPGKLRPEDLDTGSPISIGDAISLAVGGEEKGVDQAARAIEIGMNPAAPAQPGRKKRPEDPMMPPVKPVVDGRSPSFPVKKKTKKERQKQRAGTEDEPESGSPAPDEIGGTELPDKTGGNPQEIPKDPQDDIA